MTITVRFDGKFYSAIELEKLLQICEVTFYRWHKLGLLRESTIRAHLKERVRRRHLHKLRIQSGIPKELYRSRLGKNWNPERAATQPPSYRFKGSQ